MKYKIEKIGKGYLVKFKPRGMMFIEWLERARFSLREEAEEFVRSVEGLR